MSACCHFASPEGRALVGDDTAQIPSLLVGRLGNNDFDLEPVCCVLFSMQSQNCLMFYPVTDWTAETFCFLITSFDSKFVSLELNPCDSHLCWYIPFAWAF